MPVVRKLSPAEMETLEYKPKGQRKIIEEEYDRYLSDYEAGEYGEAELDGDEKRLTVRNRFKAAATRRGVGLNFLRTTGNILRFKIIAGDGQVAEQPEVAGPEPEPEPAPVKRKGGRPKKAT